MATFESRWEGTSTRQGFFLPSGMYHNNKGDWSTELPWQIRSGGELVKLGKFDDLVVSRTETWGWEMRNSAASYATFVPETAERPKLPPAQFTAGSTANWNQFEDSDTSDELNDEL